MSAAEMMILDFKQSEKVKVFGEPTEGAIDYLDYYYCLTPSKKYYLYIPSTKRVIKSFDELLDKTGIIPDISIGTNEQDWVEYVKRYYKNLKK